MSQEDYLRLANDTSNVYCTIREGLVTGDYPTLLIFEVFGTLDVALNLMMTRGLMDKRSKRIYQSMVDSYGLPTDIANRIADEQFLENGEIDFEFMGRRLIWKEHSAVYYIHAQAQ